jgi:hypothetical protein
MALSSNVSSRWTTRRAVGLHATLAIVLPGFGALTWWQVERAISGNTLSYVYSFEWPLFAAYAVYLWWKLVREAPSSQTPASGMGAPLERSTETVPASTSPAAPPQGPAAAALPLVADQPGRSGEAPAVARADEGEQAGSQVDGELAAYNRYLAELAASGQRKQLFSPRRSRRRH